jgi:hypothetical protein
MVRTLQTTRVNTNYAPLPRQAPVYPVVVEEVPVDLSRIRVEHGVILEDSSEELLLTPILLLESLAFAARSSTSAPPALAVQAPAPGGDDPDNSRDDDEDDEENVNEEANYSAGLLHGVWACHRTLHINVRDGALPQPAARRAARVGNLRPTLVRNKASVRASPGLLLHHCIHVRVMDAGDRGFKTLSAHESQTPLSTYAASVSDAARPTLWSLNHTYQQQLQDTKFRHLPLRPSGGSQTSIVPGGAGEDRLNTSWCSGRS